MHILTPISPGELIDKITILEIKLEEISDPDKLKNVRNEHALLVKAYEEHIPPSVELAGLKEQLLQANKKIWESENDVRTFWNDEKKFNGGAKQSHFYNDERAKIKRKINEFLGSTIIEEKSHPHYEHKTS
jgi:hypothetical protein